jgi:hypothetical protein
MPRVGLEPTIPVFQRAKTVHALNRAATVYRHTLDLAAEKILLSNRKLMSPRGVCYGCIMSHLSSVGRANVCSNDMLWQEPFMYIAYSYKRIIKHW